MLVFALTPLFICLANAIKFYGDVPSLEAFNHISNTHAALQNEGGNGSISSVFSTSDPIAHNGSDFLADFGLANTTLDDFINQHRGPVEIGVADAPGNMKCSGGAVQQKWSTNTISYICGIGAGAALYGQYRVGIIIDNHYCNAVSNGVQVRCKEIVLLIKLAASPWIAGQALAACKSAMNTDNEQCAGEGAEGTVPSDSSVYSLVSHTQLDKHCTDNDIGSPCTEING